MRPTSRTHHARISLEPLLSGAAEDAADLEDATSSGLSSLTPSQWLVALGLLLSLAGVCILGGLMGALWTDVHHEHDHSIRAICTRGANIALHMPHCTDSAYPVPGGALLTGDPGNENTVYARRFQSGAGVLLDEIDSSHVRVNAHLVSLSSEIVIDDSGGPDSPVSFLFTGSGGNGSDSCDLTCDENYIVRVANGGNGYGIAMGTDHVFPNDNTHRGSAILSGRENVLLMSNGSVVVGGRNNTIDGTRCSMIGVGRNNTVLSQRSVVVVGEYNIIDSSDSFIGSGQNQLIASIYEGNAIVAGSDNELLNASRSIIGAGTDNTIEASDDSGIYCGRGTLINEAATSVIGAGENNNIDGATASGIVAGAVT